MNPFPAIIWPTNGGDIDNSLPGGSGRPDNSLPGSGAYPDQGLPGGRPGRPNNGLPPAVGVWPQPPTTWPPIPPITVPPDDGAGISLPIHLPGSPDNGLPPVDVSPGHPANPIVLPPLPDGAKVMVALVLPLPNAAPKAGQPAGSVPALLWYGPGTVPQMAVLMATPAPK